MNNVLRFMTLQLAILSRLLAHPSSALPFFAHLDLDLRTFEGDSNPSDFHQKDATSQYKMLIAVQAAARQAAVRQGVRAFSSTPAQAASLRDLEHRVKSVKNIKKITVGGIHLWPSRQGFQR